MAKKKSKTRNTTRREIAKIDREILQLFEKRVKVYQNVSTDDSKLDRIERDARELEKFITNSKSVIDEADLQLIFAELNSCCREASRKTRVAFLGPIHSYSHMAVAAKFGNSVELIPVKTIPLVFEKTESGDADFGIVPLENSTNGRVSDTLTMLLDFKLKICGEIPLRIKHCLMANCELSDVRTIASKPQAIAQCREWIAKHLPDAKILETSSTTEAANMATKNRGFSAIASLQAGLANQFKHVEKSIQDSKSNFTRFSIISHNVVAKSGNDKTVAMFELPHSPGALADAMAIFKRSKLNLTWIESFPIPDVESEYYFFIEFLGHCEEAKVRKALASLEKKTIRFNVLGSFPVSDIID